MIHTDGGCRDGAKSGTGGVIRMVDGKTMRMGINQAKIIHKFGKFINTEYKLHFLKDM